MADHLAEDVKPAPGGSEELSELLRDGSPFEMRSSRDWLHTGGGMHPKGRDDVKDLALPEFWLREEPQRGGENSGGGRLRRDERAETSPMQMTAASKGEAQPIAITATAATRLGIVIGYVNARRHRPQVYGRVCWPESACVIRDRDRTARTPIRIPPIERRRRAPHVRQSRFPA